MNVGEDWVSLAYSRPNYIQAVCATPIPRYEKNMATMVNCFKNLVEKKKAEGLIVGYPSSSIIQKSDGAETKIFIDKLDKTGKFEGLKYTYWCTSLVSKTRQTPSKVLNGYCTEMIEPSFEDSANNILQGYLNCCRMVLKAAKVLDDES
ncbi:hypothetical protein Q3G72_007136 [Acer saccharum]|nr:hypothetical protein Q3G72_007136 [Acer saccharum]